LVIQFCVPALGGAFVGAMLGFNETHAHTPSLRIRIAGQFSELLNIFVLPLLAIVPALLYLKMRQFGGETLTDAMSQLQELEPTKSHWQQRMRTRLTITPQTRTPV